MYVYNIYNIYIYIVFNMYIIPWSTGPFRSRVYFLMELVSGGELLDALDSLGLLKDHQAKRVIFPWE